MRPFSPILHLFERLGDAMYGGECVSQTAHALQAAHAAECADAPARMVVAALLHDVGHLLPAAAALDVPTGDLEHERVGGQWLSSWFPPGVTEPVLLHVDAKRFLCATEPEYAGTLSMTSRASLVAQGGPMSSIEVSEFRARRFAMDAVELRRWDEAAKVVGAQTPDLSHFVGYFDQVAS